MNGQSRYAMFAMTILTVFALSAFRTVPAYADDSTPPPTETPTVETLPTEVLIEVVPAVEEVPPTEAPIMEETAPVAELLIQIPDEIQLVVVNEEGDTVPLASEEAAQLVEVVDPMWCPAGVNPGAVTCSIGYVSLSALVTDLGDGVGFVPSGNGVVWIQGGADPGAVGTSILINGLTAGFTGISNFSLTLKGGWNGCNPGCVNTVNTANPSVLDQSLSIINWNGDITLNDITFTGVTLGSASNNAALNVQTTKKITLTNVNVNSNTGAGTVNGAYLDNADADPLVFGNVSITNSKFNDNKNRGLQVFSEGTITLAGVLVNGNDAGGATLNNSTAATAKAVTIATGTNEFNNNSGIGSGDGLNVSSKGAITLKDITANSNGGDGIHLDNRFGSTVVGINFTGTTIASGNNDDGIEAYSDGTITASNLIANNNINGWGVQLNNTSATTAQPVKLTGNNEFKFNNGGLWIQSQGAITTNNVVATNNSGNDGVRLWNDYSFVSSVTMTGTNVFIDNYNDGLEIYSLGIITLSNIRANENGLPSNNGFGVTLNNSLSFTPMAVILKGTNTFNNNYSGGLEIHSKGTVTLSKITANGNQNGNGALIKNDYGIAFAPQNVTLTTANTFNDNSGSGLVMNSYGMIIIATLTANNNGAGPGADLNNSGGTFPKAVILTGNNTFNFNVNYGLKILSLGPITLNNVKAEYNLGTGGLGYGAYLNNQRPGAVGGVTINNTAGFLPSFSKNSNTGLHVLSYGTITIKNMNVSGNGSEESVGNGAYLDNDPGTGNISLGVINAEGNGYNGLKVFSNGTVTVASLNASSNYFGTLIDNTTAASPKIVTLNGTNTFYGNLNGGLQILSLGAIKVNNLDAGSSDLGFGAYLNNEWDGATGGITLTGKVYVESNQSYGLQILSHRAITIANLNLNNNQGYGAYLGNSNGLGGVTISGASQIFGSVGGNGLEIDTTGAVMLGNLTAQDNGLNGVVINNTFSGITTPQNVIITGTNYFYYNEGDGLHITTFGTITINNIDAYYNGRYVPDRMGWGAWLDNCGYNGVSCTNNGAPKGITITGKNFFEGNVEGGLWATSLGAITVSSMTANGNHGNGAYLNNRWGLALGGITLTGINTFKNNDMKGLEVYSHGVITMSNISAISNGNDGVYLSNQSLTTKGVTVTLTGVNTFSNNGQPSGTGSGLIIYSDGQITLSNVLAEGNGDSGASLDNWSYSTPTTKPGIKLTGLNRFNQNGEYGLFLISDGVIDLNWVTADLNGYDGLNAYTFEKFTLICGSMNNNGGYGWYVDASPGTTTLKGVNGFGNVLGNFNTSPQIIIRTCPVPAPVIIPPVKDDDEKVTDIPDLYTILYERR